MCDVEKILNDAGYQTVTGKDDTLKAIQEAADDSNQPLCSGYKVFPDGSVCDGCKDCETEEN